MTRYKPIKEHHLAEQDVPNQIVQSFRSSNWDIFKVFHISATRVSVSPNDLVFVWKRWTRALKWTGSQRRLINWKSKPIKSETVRRSASTRKQVQIISWLGWSPAAPTITHQKLPRQTIVCRSPSCWRLKDLRRPGPASVSWNVLGAPDTGPVLMGRWIGPLVSNSFFLAIYTYVVFTCLLIYLWKRQLRTRVDKLLILLAHGSGRVHSQKYCSNFSREKTKDGRGLK